MPDLLAEFQQNKRLIERERERATQGIARRKLMNEEKERIFVDVANLTNQKLASVTDVEDLKTQFHQEIIDAVSKVKQIISEENVTIMQGQTEFQGIKMTVEGQNRSMLQSETHTKVLTEESERIFSDIYTSTNQKFTTNDDVKAFRDQLVAQGAESLSKLQKLLTEEGMLPDARSTF